VPIGRRFTKKGSNPYNDISWARGDAELGDFSQKDVEYPADWSPKAVGVSAKLYFATVNGAKENSVRSMVRRVVEQITIWGYNAGYFGDPTGDGAWRNASAALTFFDELSYILLHQMAAFNTPVWLNLGVPGRRQCASACYLLRIEDTMLGEKMGGKGQHSIMDWVNTEAAIFKSGAGSGVNISALRGDMETLSTGGYASGPTSYMRLGDANAGTLKSGGAHRRAAKMVIEDADHPNIFDFIECKRREDGRMRTLRDAGHNIDPFTPEGEKTIAEVTSFQNANLSVGASDEFMRRATGMSTTDQWSLTARVTGDTVQTVNAGDLLRTAVDAAWVCGDPGLVFLDRANEWHTTPYLHGKYSPITTCNPCAETWLNEDSACNLASINLLKFLNSDGSFDVDGYRHTIDILITAMDICCEYSEGPTPQIDKNTRELRQLGLGYSNLGALLMCQGLAYDSPEGRDMAASVTALLTGRSYRRSAVLAQSLGAYDRYEENKATHRAVISKHNSALSRAEMPTPLWAAAVDDWSDAVEFGDVGGYRNSQVTVIAPTGTVSHLMDCDTTGCEPDFSLIKHKGLAGGGSVIIVNRAVGRAMDRLGYLPDVIEEAVEALISNDLDRFHSLIVDSDRRVFDCANDIHAHGHIDMVCAIQPFLSGAPSKTVNLAEVATREDVLDCYVRAWKGGAKCISVFRDNSKVTAALTHIKKNSPAETAAEADVAMYLPQRRRLPDTRTSVTHKFTVGGHKGYLTVGHHEDGTPGEIFVNGFGNEGSFLSGMLGCWAKAVSVGLQYGVPAEQFAHQFIGEEFEPRGETSNPEIWNASSVPDYIWRWFMARYGSVTDAEEAGVLTDDVKATMTARLDAQEVEKTGPAFFVGGEPLVDIVHKNGKFPAVPLSGKVVELRPTGTKPCHCGGVMVRTGTCWTCQRDPTHNTGCG
jgi:ribonucleoside-diphosphate reductase alpha chain